MSRVNLLLAILWLPFVVGCEGCRRGEDAEEEKAPVEDFTSRPPRAFPADASAAGSIKPGHWLTASQSLKSNKIDARGNLVNRASAAATGPDDGRDERSLGELPSIRPVVLPKGQSRRFEYRILPPLPPTSDQRRSFLDSRFVSTGRTVYYDTQPYPFSVLDREEVFFVVLTDRPERFAKMQVADWVRPFRDEFEFAEARSNYRVVIPPTKGLLPLAETMLDWTSTAVVLWDDLPPDALTPQQMTAISDWIRFGGQFIINGADGSDAVSKTVLSELLPMKPTGNVELNQDAASEMLESWAVSTDPSTEKQIALLRSQTGRVSFDGPKSTAAETVEGSSDLILSRRIGSGRVVQSRFDLTSDWLTNWSSYDSFVNAVFLSRPRRQVSDSRDADDGGLFQQFYPGLGDVATDPALNTRFRIAARDAILRGGAPESGRYSGVYSVYDPLTGVDSQAGISGWTDTSDVIGLSRQILGSESGIEIPKSSLVVRALGYYLLILVPVNYIVFRLLGRLEYAWLAVPVIAIVGAIWVARAARLDIGFARSQTEIGFLEVHSGYPRAHLSRVVAIYNSLSSTYDVEFDTFDASAAPVRPSRPVQEDDGTRFETGFGAGPMMSGFAVVSNQVRMVHAEQIIDLGGTIAVDNNGRLLNQSMLEFSDSIVVEKDESGEARVALIGPLGPGAAKEMRFRAMDEVSLPEDLPMQTTRLIRGLAASESMPAGSMRLVARYDGALEGMTISPATQQSSSQTVVLAHLKYAPYPEAKADVNLIGDFREALTDEETEAGEEDDADE